MAYFSGNARLKASALNVIKSYEAWTPFEILGATVVSAPISPIFFRLRHIAFLDIQITVDSPEQVLVTLPSFITTNIAPYAQVSPAICARHGIDVSTERWISMGTATVDTTRTDGRAFYISIASEAGYLQDRTYDISTQIQLELL